MALNDIFRMAIVGTGPNAQQLVNVHHYRQTTSGGGDLGDHLGRAWIDTASAAWQACVTDDSAVLVLQIRNVTQPTLGVDFTDDLPLAGTQGGEAMPPNSPFIISWRTGLIGRARRGRTYMWPAEEAAQNAGQISGGQSALYTTYATAMLALSDPDTTAEFEMVIHSEVVLEDNVVTTFVIPQFAGTQRRRRSGVGA